MEQAHSRTIRRVRHELHRREVVVTRVEPLGAHFAAISFHAESLAAFLSLSFDDHVKFVFAGANGDEVRRDYTPRRFDAQARELTIEFALHGDGAASDWARRAQPGDKAQLTRLIRALRDRGLLEARADEADRRSTRLRLSRSGEALHALWHRHGAAAAEEALAGLPDAERAQLLALLERVRANLDAADKD